jgi:hypothetical protein
VDGKEALNRKGDTFHTVSIDLKEKTPGITRGFFKELEFKVFFRTVNQAGFSGIFGYFSDIGYIKYRFETLSTQAHYHSICYRRNTNKPKAYFR